MSIKVETTFEAKAGDRSLTLTYNPSTGWINFRSALLKPKVAKPGAYRRFKRAVQNQGYNVHEGRWSQTSDALTAETKREAIILARQNGLPIW